MALELSVGAASGACVLSRLQADQLGQRIAMDMARLLPGADRLDLVVLGAHFDPAEVLRPGWPVHAALAGIGERAPGNPGGRLIALGQHGGQMPATTLAPDSQFEGGLLRVLPFALLGDAADVAAVGADMEARLLDTGMADAATALDAQQLFGLTLEHARYMSLHDLCAMTAMQYEHAGVEDVWRLIEALLLGPDGTEYVEVGGGLPALAAAGRVLIAVSQDSGRRGDPLMARTRAILAAHGVAVEGIPLAANEDAERMLRSASVSH
jgi:hypothetical protein